MTPAPDHGETSYRGSGKLEGKRALITGGDSGIGQRGGDRLSPARAHRRRRSNHLPAEEPDAREVIEPDRVARPQGASAPCPGDLRDEAFCRRLVD